MPSWASLIESDEDLAHLISWNHQAVIFCGEIVLSHRFWCSALRQAIGATRRIHYSFVERERQWGPRESQTLVQANLHKHQRKLLLRVNKTMATKQNINLPPSGMQGLLFTAHLVQCSTGFTDGIFRLLDWLYMITMASMANSMPSVAGSCLLCIQHEVFCIAGVRSWAGLDGVDHGHRDRPFQLHLRVNCSNCCACLDQWNCHNAKTRPRQTQCLAKSLGMWIEWIRRISEMI